MTTPDAPVPPPFPPPPSGVPVYGQPAYGMPPLGPSPYGAVGYGQPGPPDGLVFASPWTRLAASLINGVLLVVTLGIGYLVWTMVLWTQGTNPGKKMLGMRVVDARTGQPATWGHMFVRNFLVGGLLIAVLGGLTLYIVTVVDAALIFGDKRQRLTDRISSTYVVTG